MAARLSPSRLGLRWRLVAALVLTSAATLGIAALSLLGPLEQRLRSEELSKLSDTSATIRPGFAAFTVADVADLSPAFHDLVDGLRQRTRARAVVLDAAGRRYYDTDPQDADFPEAFRALASNAPVSDLGPGRGGGSARVAIPVRVRGGTRFVVFLRRPLGDTRSAARVVTRAFVVAALTGLVLAVLLGVGLATTLLHRLRRLRQGALALADSGLAGDLADAPSFDISGRDEIGDLGRAFRTMHERLRRQEQTRQAFLSTASHELRTPLAGLRGMLELLEEDLAAPNPDLDDARRQLTKAQGQSRRLAALAADLLDLSRLDAGLHLRSEAVELGELARAVGAEFEARASESAVTLAVAPDGSEHWARADPGALARVVRILLDNALRFTPTAGRITVRLGGEGGRASLTVEDEGPGVADEDRERIFERFERGRPTAVAGGFGLGLAIGRELARGMGGELRLLAGEPGACFELDLPAAGPAELGEEPESLQPGGSHEPAGDHRPGLTEAQPQTSAR